VSQISKLEVVFLPVTTPTTPQLLLNLLI